MNEQGRDNAKSIIAFVLVMIALAFLAYKYKIS